MKTAEYSDYKKLGDGLVTVKIVVCGEHDPSRVVAAIESAIKILSSGLQSPALSSFEPDYDANVTEWPDIHVGVAAIDDTPKPKIGAAKRRLRRNKREAKAKDKPKSRESSI